MLLHATHIIANHGIHQLEVKKLARAANSSTSQFHAYFTCRDQLLVEVFNEGWNIIQHCIVRRICRPMKNTLDLAAAVLHGVLDAFDENEEAVSATLMLGFETVGQPVRERLRETPGFKYFKTMSEHLQGEFARSIPEQESKAIIQLMLGAVVRHLMLKTPMYQDQCKKYGAPLERDAFVSVMSRMLEGLINDRKSAETAGQASELKDDVEGRTS